MIKPTLVLGNNPCAHQIVSSLLSCGKPVFMATGDTVSEFEKTEYAKWETFELLKDTSVLQCRGQVGNFRVKLTRNGEAFFRNAETIIISETADREPNLGVYGLTAGSFVLPISALAAKNTPDTAFLADRNVAFLTGLYAETGPLMMKNVLKAAHRLQTRFNSQTYIFTSHLKVAGKGLEALSREVKKSGTVFYKFPETLLKIFQNPDGRVHITFIDEITRHDFTLEPDAVIVDETFVPSPCLRNFSRIFDLDTDTSGYLQTDNVHRTSVMTNRKGILVTGQSRSVQTESAQQADAKAAVITALSLAEASASGVPDKAEIDTGRCIRCLTCFRICPHRAVTKERNRVEITPEACEGCSICTAECPREAIRLTDLNPLNLKDHLAQHQQKPETSNPLIVAFCCRRSAFTAGETARSNSDRLPVNLIRVPVPCAGGISISHILTAFQHGADGVMLLSCHEGNCHSEQGNRFASHRMNRLIGMLSNIGIEPERLLLDSLAANMAFEFAQKTSRFQEKIRRSHGQIRIP